MESIIPKLKFSLDCKLKHPPPRHQNQQGRKKGQHRQWYLLLPSVYHLFPFILFLRGRGFLWFSFASVIYTFIKFKKATSLSFNICKINRMIQNMPIPIKANLTCQFHQWVGRHLCCL